MTQFQLDLKTTHHFLVEPLRPFGRTEAFRIEVLGDPPGRQTLFAQFTQRATRRG